MDNIEKGGSLWESLTEEQKQGVLTAYEESEDDANLIPFEEIKAKYKDWPLKSE